MGSGGDKLVVITCNIGDHGTWADIKGMLDNCDVMTLQEMSDRQGIIDNLNDVGWKTYNAGGDNGRAATPIAWDPKVMGEVQDKYCKQLSPKTHAPGTGPDTVKPKYLIGVGWDYPKYNKRVRVGGLHLVSDSGPDNKKRHDLAHDEIVIASKMWKGDEGFPDGFCCIAGDWNTNHNNDLLDPMRNQNWKSAQNHGTGPIKTFKDRTIDNQWYRNGSIHNQGKINTGSDHHAYWVSYNLG